MTKIKIDKVYDVFKDLDAIKLIALFNKENKEFIGKLLAIAFLNEEVNCNGKFNYRLSDD